MDTETFDPEEVVTSFTPSSTVKLIVVGLGALVVGVVVGISISSILSEAKSPAPRIPTRVHEEETTLEEYLEEEKPVVKADLKFPTPAETLEVEETSGE
jgi:hypothetical protein